MELILGGIFVVKTQIGFGALESVYVGQNTKTGQEVAIKLESNSLEVSRHHYEIKAYNLLIKAPGFPKIHWTGLENTSKVLVLDLLGPCLENLFDFCNRQFSLKTTLLLAEQMLNRIQNVHLARLVHRDIRPESFLVGPGANNHVVNLVNFGEARSYTTPVTGKHVPSKRYETTAKPSVFASIKAHSGLRESRRDDLEALGYLLIYFFKGRLPWQNVSSDTEQEMHAKLLENKLNTPVEVLCEGCPPEFMLYLTYCRAIEYEDNPDYEFLRRVFRSLFERKGYEYDFKFDWIVLQEQQNISLAT